MRIINITGKIFFLSVFIILGGCDPELETCQKTEWPQSKMYEIKLAVRLSESNPDFPDAVTGSKKPWEFEKMVVSGNMKKIECDGEITGSAKLGNTYISQEDFSEPITVPATYWIGHAVYVYEFDNDVDNLDIALSVKVTMADGNSYSCYFSEVYYHNGIVQAPGTLYHYILIDVYSDLWLKFY